MMRARRRQAGATLVIGMIMLMLMTLLAVTSFGLGRGEMQIISNMQWRNDAQSAAQRAVEEVISSPNFASNPAAVFTAPCSGANTVCYDTNGDAVADVTGTVKSRSEPAKPTCLTAKIVKNSALNLSIPNDLGCATGAPQAFGVAGAAPGNPLCADSIWDIQAEAFDAVTQARATITQGVAVRVSSDNVAASCP